jgi:predicted DNA-binding antitoxin AbrB/MazE fold protein
MMKAIPAVFERGVFRPTVPVTLPENCQVELELRVQSDSEKRCGPREKTEQASAKLPIEVTLAALAQRIPPDEWNRLPRDLTDNLDNHLYGA